MTLVSVLYYLLVVYADHDASLAYRKNFEQFTKIQLKSGFFMKNVTNLNLQYVPQLLLIRFITNGDFRTTILGQKYSRPFFIAPAAFAGLAHPDAELNLVSAASKAGILYVSSITSTKTTEEIGAAAAKAKSTQFRQLYPWTNETLVREDVRRIEKAGFKAIFLTVDKYVCARLFLAHGLMKFFIARTKLVFVFAHCAVAHLWLPGMFVNLHPIIETDTSIR